METITLGVFENAEGQQLSIAYTYNEAVQKDIKEIQGLTWCTKKGVYYLPFSIGNKNLVYAHLRKRGYFVDVQQIKNLKLLLEPKKEFNQGESLPREHKRALHKFVDYLRGRRYSESTVRTYYSFLLKFLCYHPKPIEELTQRDVELFVEGVIAKQKYSISTHRQCISAIKHFSTLFCIPALLNVELKRPKKSQFLPTVLSKEEVIRLLQVTRNLKHRAILALIYSAGLRIGEVIDLKLADIDVTRRQIHIRQAKGRKDRFALLAESMMPLLSNYIATYQPKEFFVEGQEGGAYSTSSVRHFLKESCKRAGIKKRVTPHTLRHSFATHMMENGIGLRHIQELLGHAKPETTMVYTHVARKDLMQLQSPLDHSVREILGDGKNGENLRLSGEY